MREKGGGKRKKISKSASFYSKQGIFMVRTKKGIYSPLPHTP